MNVENARCSNNSNTLIFCGISVQQAWKLLQRYEHVAVLSIWGEALAHCRSIFSISPQFHLGTCTTGLQRGHFLSTLFIAVSTSLSPFVKVPRHTLPHRKPRELALSPEPLSSEVHDFTNEISLPRKKLQ